MISFYFIILIMDPIILNKIKIDKNAIIKHLLQNKKNINTLLNTHIEPLHKFTPF